MLVVPAALGVTVMEPELLLETSACETVALVESADSKW
jgi:hypothetical protein